MAEAFSFWANGSPVVFSDDNELTHWINRAPYPFFSYNAGMDAGGAWGKDEFGATE